MRKSFFIGDGQGNSMKPIINDGDKLFVEKVKFRDLKIGDIVVFYRDKNLIGHRVIGIKGTTIICKGDNLPFFDLPLTVKEIIGKVVKIEGKYGKINLLSNSSRIINIYFIFYSLTTYYIPFWIRLFLIKILRGRKALTSFLSKAS